MSPGRIDFGPETVPPKFPMLLKVKKSNVFNQDNLENVALGFFYQGEAKVYTVIHLKFTYVPLYVCKME